MGASLHERAGQLLLAALRRPEAERSAFLDDACGADAALRAEVASLLAAADRDVAFLDEIDGLGIFPDPPADAPLLGQRVGQFLIRRVIGSGGMGTVYEALQERPRRVVALKVIRRSLASASARRRLEYEAELLGYLRHPGIAQVYESGLHDDGSGSVPYFAMEYVQDARPITDYAAHHELGLRDRLSLLALVCDAVHHGHQKGVVHRDLKPDNVLVDVNGQPRVIDFGVARATDADIQLTTQHTDVGQLVGTLPYMSPEQVLGDPTGVDTRTDVYALGVLLFELLTGRLPIDARGRSLIEAVSATRAAEPRKLGSVDRALRGDLETIAAKALEKEKARRYESAAELAADLRRFLNEQPIAARPPTAMYQLRKFARRNRGLVGGAAIGAAALLIGTAVSINQAYLATRARNVARQQERGAHYQAYLAGIAAAAAALENHDVPLARRSLARAPAHLRGWEWHYLHGRLDQSLLVIPAAERPPGDTVRFLADGIVAAWDDRAQLWRRWQVPGGAPLPGLPAEDAATRAPHGPAELHLRDGQATIRAADPETTRTFDLRALGIREEVWSQRSHLSDDGRLLAFNSLSRAALLDTGTGELFTLEFDSRRQGTAAAALGRSGLLAIGTANLGLPAVWDPRAATLRPLAGSSAPALDIAFDPTGTRVAAVLADATVRLWDAHSGALLATGRGHTNAAVCVGFSPDGALIATAGNDRTLRLWRADTLEPLGVLHGHDDGITFLQFNDSGTRVVTGAARADRTIRVWDVAARGNPTVLRGHRSYVYPVAISPDGRTVASGAWDREIRLWDADRFRPTGRLTGSQAYLLELCFSPDGRRLLSYGGDDMLRLWDVASGAELRHSAWKASRARPAFYPDGRYVLLPSRAGGSVTVWDTETGALTPRPLADIARLRRGPVSADGRFAVLLDDDQYRLLRLADGRPALDTPVCGVFAFGIGPTANLLAAVDPEARCVVQLRDLDSLDVVGTLHGHTGRSVWDITFSPDGSRIATAGDDQVIRLWDAATFDEVLQLRGHSAYVWSLAFRPDGTQLVSGSGDHTARVWDTRPFADRLSQAPSR